MTSNVYDETKEIRQMDLLHILDVRIDKMKWFKEYEKESMARRSIITHAISSHPCLTWRHIVLNLQKYGYNEVAAEITRRYIVGQSFSQIFYIEMAGLI